MFSIFTFSNTILRHRNQIFLSFFFSLLEMMINDDQKYPIELMQSTSVNHKHVRFSSFSFFRKSNNKLY